MAGPKCSRWSWTRTTGNLEPRERVDGTRERVALWRKGGAARRARRERRVVKRTRPRTRRGVYVRASRNPHGCLLRVVSAPVQAEVAADGERLMLDLGLGLDLGLELYLGRSRLTRASRFARRALVFVLAVRARVADRAVVFQLAVRAALAVHAVVLQLVVRAGRAVHAVPFHLATRAGVAVHAPALQLLVRTGLAVRADAFQLAMRARGAVRAVVFQPAVRARGALNAPAFLLPVPTPLVPHRYARESHLALGWRVPPPRAAGCAHERRVVASSRKALRTICFII